MRIRWRFAPLVVMLVLIRPAGCVQDASACSCAAATGRKALPYAAAMFRGKASRVEFLEPDTHYSKEPRIRVTFEVSEVWKGPVQRRLVLQTIYNKWSCSGYYFKETEEYLVTAYHVKAPQPDGSIEIAGVNPCGATRELARATEVIRELGVGDKPAETPPTQGQGR